MRFIIQDRNSVIFNGIKISDEVKSQVTSIDFITQDINYTRNLTVFEKIKVKLFGNYTKTEDFLKPTTLKKGKKYSIYIENAEKYEFSKGTLIVICKSVFINENGKIFVEAAKSADSLNETRNVKW